MALDTTIHSRDYLYGRLLAVAESIEDFASKDFGDGDKRTTNAERMLQRFATYPFSTWLNLEQSLQPYMERLKVRNTGFFVKRKNELDEIMSSFNSEEFKDDKKLSGEFLLGYHCQRHFYHAKNVETTIKNTNNN